MQKTMNIILKAAAALLAVTLAASCVFEKEEPSQTQQKYKYVLVQLGVNTDKMIATKADGDVTESDPETAIKDLKVYAYTLDASNNKVLRGYLSTQNVNAAATATQPLLMDIKVPFEEYGSTQQVYFMAVANAGGMTGTGDVIINSIGRAEDGSLVLPESFGFEDFASIRYSVADQTFANGMPMYCQTSAAVTVNLGATEGTSTSTQPGHNGHTNLPVQVTLDMTRSLSKIEVYAAEDAGQGTSGTSNAGIQITGVELMNVIADGPLFPAAASTTKLTTNPTLAGKAVALAASAAHKADPSKYTKITDAYYLAENDYGVDGKFYYGDDFDKIAETHELTADDLKATTLKIGYKVGINGDQKYGYVIMPPIERNTWYKVLARITAGGQMNLTFVAQPWNLIEETWDFTDQISVDKSFEWTGGTRETDEDNNKEIISTKTANLTCSFNIATPRYATWKAEFIPVSGDPKAFKFVTQNGLEDSVTGNVGTAANLIIQPRVAPVNQENEVKLRITVITKDGLTIFAKALMPEDAVADEFTIIQSY